MRNVLVAALLVGMGAGCYSPSYGDCEVTCGPSMACPSGYDCHGGFCRVGGASGSCNSADAGDDGGLQPSNFQTRVLSAQCGLYARCGIYESEAVCEEQRGGSAITERLFANVEVAIQMGKVRFDPAAGQACLDSYEQIPCTRDQIDNPRARSPACLSALSGTVPAGGACAFNQECISQECSVQANCPVGACCVGNCVGSTPPTTRAVGEPCTTHDVCVNGYCDATNPNGAICRDYAGMLAPCQNSDQCTPGTYCHSSGTSSMCFPLANTNSSCSDGNPSCSSTADVCSNAICTPTGLTGAPCDTATNMVCQDFHICASDGKCDTLPTAGEPCTFPPICAVGAYCNGGTCVARDPDGTACDPGAPNPGNTCESHYCEPGTMQCTAAPVCT